MTRSRSIASAAKSPQPPSCRRVDVLCRQQVLAVISVALLCVSASVFPDRICAQDEQRPVAVEAGAQPDNAGGAPDAAKQSATAGKSARRKAIPSDAAGIVEALGWGFVIPFVFASVIAVWFSIERIVVLRRGRVIPRPFVERFLQHLSEGKLDPAEALRLCEENGSPVAQVFAHGIRKWGKPSVEVEQAVIDGGERQVSQLRNHLRVINGVATLTPLLGLLGTVIGMIQAFNDIAASAAMGKTEELAVGIALALLTTAVGLMIAIPTLTVYMFLAGRVDARVMEMDELAQNIVHLISAEALASQPLPTGRGTAHRPVTSSGLAAKEKKAV